MEPIIPPVGEGFTVLTLQVHKAFITAWAMHKSIIVTGDANG